MGYALRQLREFISIGYELLVDCFDVSKAI